ncbi:type II toxin-antitoxin system RelE/ParE family toxin [Sorangium cellulosum]|uniref:type II toxin-antitoxin system RelE/ParE family toxin n=1 Tax=Sorangium cellulosum TaxID=56 RepID=UPI003D9A7F0B
MRVELHPEARAELRAVAVWYDERRPGLGDEFVDEVSSIIARIGEAPGSFPRWPTTSPASVHIGRAVLGRFPYVIAFEVHAERVLVLAIAHAKRRPLYWLARAV